MADTSETRIAALEAELAQLRGEVQEFTASVTHDLRAPLRHILSYAQLVQEDAGPLLTDEVQDFLLTITDSARHLGLLLDGLSALSRLGSAPLALGPVDLQLVVQEICDGLSSDQPLRQIQWHVAGDLPLVLADAPLLRQALVQVLGNASKFSAAREPAVIDVTASTDAGQRYVHLHVRDNGVGYNPALQGKLFRVFGRLHSAQQFEGIGMGLVLTQKIARRLGGAVSIEGVVDGGCCVTLTLPLSK